MDPQKIIASLPTLADGAVAYLGQPVFRYFLSNLYTAVVEGITDQRLTLRYTSDFGRHKGCVTRAARPCEWYATPPVPE